MPFYLLLHATGAAFRLFFIATAGGVVISAYIFISLKIFVVYVCMCVFKYYIHIIASFSGRHEVICCYNAELANICVLEILKLNVVECEKIKIKQVRKR